VFCFLVPAALTTVVVVTTTAVVRAEACFNDNGGGTSLGTLQPPCIGSGPRATFGIPPGATFGIMAIVSAPPVRPPT
jgi:hypothetical protein